jgi:hypothetical protein
MENNSKKKNTVPIVRIIVTILAAAIGWLMYENEDLKNKSPDIKVIKRETLTLIKKIDEKQFAKIVQYVKIKESFTATTQNVYDFLPMSDDVSSIQVGARRPIEQGQKIKDKDLIYLMVMLPDGVWTWEKRSPELDIAVEKDLEEFISTIQRL